MEFLRLLEGIRSPFLDTTIGLITQLGEETVAIVILCAIFWCISKRVAYGIGVAYFMSGLTVQGMKICFRIDRPWILDPTLNTVSSAKVHATGYSFPSGHTQSATALFGSLGVQVRQKPLKALFFLLVLLVGFSRMYLGVHTPLDVIVSLLVTALLVFVATLIFKGDSALADGAAGRSVGPGAGAGKSKGKGANTNIGEKPQIVREAVISSLMVLFAICVIVVAVVLRSSGKIEENYVSDCLKSAGAGIGFAVGMFIERMYIKFSVKTKNLLLQILKYILGFAGVMIIKEGMKLVVGTGLVVDTIRYFLMLMWVATGYPLIIKRFFKVKAQ